MHCGLKTNGYTNKTNVPADLQSAGIEYKDFSIRLLPIANL